MLLKPLGASEQLGPPEMQDADPSITCSPPASPWGDKLSLPKYIPMPWGWRVGDIHPCQLSGHPQTFALSTATFFPAQTLPSLAFPLSTH